MKTNVFLELFSSKSDICCDFNIPEETLNDKTIIFAFYEYENYSGEALVIYRDDKTGIFYEVSGGHCSCYGLEDQWDPIELGDEEFFKEYSKKLGIAYDWSTDSHKYVYDYIF